MFSWAANQHIIMISEGSYAGDAENAAAHHCNQLHLTIYSHVKWLFKL